MISPEGSYVRLTKIEGSLGLASEESMALVDQSREGSPGHRLHVGYVMDGWFLETPRIGRSLLMLRFRRNNTHRLGVFMSSPVTSIKETEIRTKNSAYRIELLSFDRLEQT